MSPPCSVIVVNYRTPDDLGEFLDSVPDATEPGRSEIAIVNVAPQSGDIEVAKFYKRSLEDVYGFKVRNVVHPGNVGYSQACNLAAAGAKGDVLAFFNADVVLTESSVDDCVEMLNSNDHWAVLGPRQVDQNGKITHAGIEGNERRCKPRVFHHDDAGQFTDIEEMVSVAGSAYFVKAEVWHQLAECPEYQAYLRAADLPRNGAFLPTPHYYEETWLSYHARAHGRAVVYNGACTIVHKWHRASPVGGPAENEHMPVSRRLFRDCCDAHGIPHD